MNRNSLEKHLLGAFRFAGFEKRAAQITAGKLKLRIEHRYPLSQAQQAHRDLEGRKTTGKLVLLPKT